MKKFASLFLVFALSTVIVLPANATAEESPLSIKDMYFEASSEFQIVSRSTDLSPVAIDAQMTNAEGDIYDVTIFEYIPAAKTLANGSHTKTYVYSTNNISPRSVGMSMSGEGWDDSYSVYGSITITYNSMPNGLDTEYLLTNVSGGWEKSDSRVSMSNRYVAYTCQYVFAQQQVTWKYPSSNSFDYNTGYSQYVPDDGTSSVLGGLCSVDLAHGSASTWTLTIQTNLFANDIGDFIT